MRLSGSDLKAALAFGGLVAAVVGGMCIPADGAALPGGWQPGPASYGRTSTRTDVRMSDGVSLSATITSPTLSGKRAPGRFPVVLTLTPYGKDEPGVQGVNVTPASDFVPHGYIDVVVDVRGTGSSGGSFELLGPREVQDSVELVDWASHLRGSDGRVGMAGESYAALAQWFAAGAVPPGSPLKAIFPIDGGSDLYRDLAVPGGMFNSLFDTPYAALEVGMDTAGPATSGHAPQRALQDLGMHLAGNAEIDGRTTSDAFDGGDRAYDQDFWRERDLAAAIARVPANRVAALAYNALFDIWERGDTLTYSIVQNAADRRAPLAPMVPGQRVDPRFQVVLGPYVHAQSGSLLEAQLGKLALEWFDTWLKHERTGITATSAPLHAYELLGGRWTDGATWPPASSRPLKLRFAAGPSGSGARSLNDGALSQAAPPGGSDRLRWNGGVNSPCSRETYEQANALVFVTPSSENPCFYDERTFEANGLTYTSAPLKRALTIAGPGDVTVYARANTPNSEWVVTVADVAADAAARPLMTGDLIGSLRALDPARDWTRDGELIAPWHPFTRASEKPVTPGALERYDVELPGTFARIAAGHRIRVTVQSSYAPYLEPTLPDQAQLFGGSYDVARGLSSVTLPVLAPGDLRTSAVDWGPCVTDCGTP